jgi:hypothetical protein
VGKQFAQAIFIGMNQGPDGKILKLFWVKNQQSQKTVHRSICVHRFSRDVTEIRRHHRNFICQIASGALRASSASAILIATKLAFN